MTALAAVLLALAALAAILGVYLTVVNGRITAAIRVEVTGRRKDTP